MVERRGLRETSTIPLDMNVLLTTRDIVTIIHMSDWQRRNLQVDGKFFKKSAWNALKKRNNTMITDL